MFEIYIKSDFSSAHFLREYKGKCEDLHGHNWDVEVLILAKNVNKIGIAIDFKELKYKLNAILEKLDHKCLNNLSYFKKINPTSENIAKYIFDQLKPRLKNKFIKLFKVTVWESKSSYASYSR